MLIQRLDEKRREFLAADEIDSPDRLEANVNMGGLVAVRLEERTIDTAIKPRALPNVPVLTNYTIPE